MIQEIITTNYTYFKVSTQIKRYRTNSWLEPILFLALIDMNNIDILSYR